MAGALQGQIASFDISAEDLNASMEDVISGDHDESDIPEPDILPEVRASPTSEEVNKAIRGESQVYPSGSTPLMKQVDMSKDIESSAKSEEDIVDRKFRDAELIVRSWSKHSGRGLTRDEKGCLIAAVMSGETHDEKTFPSILLGYHLRGEHNVNEIRNVANAMQELLNGMIASHKGIDSASKRAMSGIETAVAKGIQAGMTPSHGLPATIPAMRSPVAISAVDHVDKAPSAPTASIINRAIEDIKAGEEGYIIDAGEFYKLTGRDEEYISRVLKIPNVPEHVSKYLNEAKVSPTIGKSKAWTEFLAYTRSM
uniref:ORF2 protein n=1 Tax=Beet oak leaf virus TaxID=3054764 RepID=A0AA49X1L9_9VIRU|nr:ORF2 protein [Beet oak leaf virus]